MPARPLWTEDAAAGESLLPRVGSLWWVVIAGTSLGRRIVIEQGSRMFPAAEGLWTAAWIAYGIVLLAIGVAMLRAMYRWAIARIRSTKAGRAADLKLW